MSTRQLNVQIMGQSYILGCPEGGEEGLLAAVRKVDAAMCQIRDAGKIKARDRIAVLAALNLAFESLQPSTHAAGVASAPQTPQTPLTSPAPEQRLNDLLERMDRVLKQDGQLI
jgi:cell division protein ZapA